jgi:hypothetical protein
MHCNQRGVIEWRNLDPAVKLAWKTFADTYPQPSHSDPNIFLNGYQLFVKRNFYVMLHDGINSDFLLYPELSSLPVPDFYAEINDSGMCIDCTEWYLKNFGILPAIGNSILCRIVPMAVNSGQFFASYQANLTVEEIYIDGLFMSIFITPPIKNIEYSIYLSYPVKPGVIYQSTKFRFMACFRPTQFIQLTDVPSSYVDEGSKFVAVKSDETGLEFVEAPEPGINCDDLIDCEIIQDIQAELIAVINFAQQAHSSSMPAVNRGLLYNSYVQKDPRGIFPSPWRLPTRAEINSYIAAYGGGSFAGGHLKETGFTYWNTPNTGADNSTKYNGRAAGFRGPGGSYPLPGEETYYLTSTLYDALRYHCWVVLYNQAGMTVDYPTGVNYGVIFRPVNPATTLTNGQTGVYIGNNGRIYRTICFNGLEHLADDLAETLYNDGSAIPLVTNGPLWWGLTSGAYCYVYGNNSYT